MHPGSSIGLDAHRDLVGTGVGIKMLTQERMQAGHPSHTLREPRLGQPVTRLILDLDVVVILGPVVPDEQHNGLRSLNITDGASAACGRTTSGLMNKCSRHCRGGHDIPSAV